MTLLTIRLRLLQLTALAGMLAAMPATRAAVLPSALINVNLPLPSANAFEVSVAFGPNDGLLYVWTGASVLKQNAIDANSFTSIGNVGSGSADASPIAFSRDASAILVGNGSGGFVPAGNANLIFGIPSSGGNSATPVGNVPFHFSFLATPALLPATSYFLNQGNATFSASSISVFDSVSGTNIPVVQNIPGASTFMALDGANRLYVGIGFGPDRGELRRFSLASLDNAFDTTTPLEWTAGELFNDVDNNSGAGMFFDARGYLFVGGPNGVTVFDPSGNYLLYENGGFTSVEYDPFGDRFLVRGFGNEQGIYPASAFLVPEPSSMVLALVASGAILALARRGRRLRAGESRTCLVAGHCCL